MNLKTSRLSDTSWLWLAAFVIFLGGSYVLETHYGRSIAESVSRSDSLYARTIANERTIAEAPSLKRLQSVVESDLRSLSRDMPLSLSTAQLLEMLESTSVSHHADVIAVLPEQGQSFSSGTAESATPETPWLKPTAVTIKLRGKFPDLLYFIEALSRQQTPLEIGDAQLSMDPAESSGGSVLDADVHTTLYRLELPADEEHRIESTR